MGTKAILDWNEYLKTARETVAEGCVLLKNDNKALPLDKNENVAVFGRIQNHYYKSGTGSGGMVNVSKVVSIPEGLIESGAVTLNEELLSIYKKWESENPYEEGMGIMFCKNIMDDMIYERKDGYNVLKMYKKF